MSWTKRQFIQAAYEEIGLADYIFDIETDALQSALRRLDSMMGMWSSKGINIGYPIASEPENADLDTETNVPDSANEAIYLKLALKIAPGHGKNVSPDTRSAANYAYKELLNATALPQEMQFPNTLPTGAGNKGWRETYQPYVNKPDLEPLGNADNGDLIFRD
jgi:hypothetical protein